MTYITVQAIQYGHTKRLLENIKQKFTGAVIQESQKKFKDKTCEEKNPYKRMINILQIIKITGKIKINQKLKHQLDDNTVNMPY